jgi:hypothetical protein
MKLNFNDPKYYHGLFNKICDMKFGEQELKHKSDEDKEKFENHVKCWIDGKDFEQHGFYVVFSDDYTKMNKFTYTAELKKELPEHITLKDLK